VWGGIVQRVCFLAFFRGAAKSAAGLARAGAFVMPLVAATALDHLCSRREISSCCSDTEKG